jgi:AcrR family transcriptional regulator
MSGDEPAPRRRPGPSPVATQAAILDAAEQLFADRGLHGVSLREVAEAAGQRNNAAVHYHFGGRDELVQALFERRFVELDQRRAAMLAALDEHGRGRDLDGLVEALVLPFTECMQRDGRSSWVRLVAKLHEDPRFNPFSAVADDSRPYTASEETTVATREVALRIQDVLGIDRAQAIAQFFIVTSMVVHAVADRESLACSGAAGQLGSPDELAARLVEAANAILRTPASAPADRRRRPTTARGTTP